jgi:hypothetical protein
MASHYLFSFTLSESDAAVSNTIARITRSILVHDFCLPAYKPMIDISVDPFLPTATQVRWEVEDLQDQDRRQTEIIDVVDHCFLSALQRILVGGAASAAWPMEIFDWQMPNFQSPGHVHANSHRMLRRLSSPKVTGTRITLFNRAREPILSLALGQPLGLVETSSVGLLSGQVQHPRPVAHCRNAISLRPRRGKPRTLLVGDGIDPGRLDGKIIVAVVRPVRGKIFNRLEGWTTPQYSLF